MIKKITTKIFPIKNGARIDFSNGQSENFDKNESCVNDKEVLAGHNIANAVVAASYFDRMPLKQQLEYLKELKE